MAEIGFIGLGNMGGPMAKNLVAAGKSVKGFDVVPTALETARANGIEVDINRLGWVTHDSGKRVKEYRVGLYEPAFRNGKRVKGQYLGEHYWYFDRHGERIEIDTGEKSPLERPLEKLFEEEPTGPIV